jgi:hypothetical protein
MQPSRNAGERGMAVVVVLAVLVLILAFMAGNNVTLRSLHREMQLIEQRQLRKYELPHPRPGAVRQAEGGNPNPATAPASAPPPPPTVVPAQ